MSMTMKDFCDGLRAAGAKLAKGEIPEFVLKDFSLEQSLEPEDARKVTASYIRTIMGRVPEVKEVGSVKIKRIKGNDEMPDGFYITINKEPRKKVLTTDDKAMIERRAVEKAFAPLLQLMPNVTDLKGEQLQGAMIAIGRYQEMIERIVKGE